MTLERDAYAVLQVDPRADFDVIHAAYRALARRYHPDGRAPDAVRMSEVNRAYDQVKTPELRQRYDQGGRQPVAVGPGREPQAVFRVDPWARRRAAHVAEDEVVDFGRYAGWRISDLARHDPEYLRWLSRHSGGIRYRRVIARHLPGDANIGRRGTSVG